MAVPPLTTTAMLAAGAEALVGADYREVDESRAGEWANRGARVFENLYSVAALVAYETWEGLAHGWLDGQASLTNLISAHFQREDAKAWEGYLVLMTPGTVPQDEAVEAARIRRDTTHARKLLITGDELGSIDDVELGLLPLLPLPAREVEAEGENALDLLPALLARHAISEDAARIAIAAFKDQESAAERLHAFLHEESDS